MRTFCFLLVVLFFQAPVHAETHQWVGEYGQRHFTDSPPPGKRSMEQASIKLVSGKIAQDTGDSCKKISATYVEEINSKSRSKWEERLHPKVRSCIPGQTDYFDFAFSIKKRKPVIPPDYDVKCEAINPADPLPFEDEKMMYTERPNYRMTLDYKIDKPDSFGSDIVHILKEQDKWHLILPCLTEFGLKKYQERKR